MLTRYVELVALRRITSETTARALYNTVIQRHGIPRVLISDRGSNFTSMTFETLLKMLNIQHHLTPSYRPQANGVTERANQTIKNMLAMVMAENKSEDWDEFLPAIQGSYNRTVHTSTAETPFFALYGRDMRHPLLSQDEGLTANESGTKVAETLEKCHEAIIQRLAQPKHRPRRRTQPHRVKEYEPGQLVLVGKPVTGTGRSLKLKLW